MCLRGRRPLPVLLLPSGLVRSTGRRNTLRSHQHRRFRSTSCIEDLRAWLAERGPDTALVPEPRLSRKEAAARLHRDLFDEDPDDTDAELPDDLDDEELDDEDRRPNPMRDWEFAVSRVAGRLSVSPESLGPDTRVSGTGVLAMPRALRDRPRYGALPV